MEYLNLFFGANMQPHFQHALDINPVKSLYQAEDSGFFNGKLLQDPDSLNLNKGKCQALCLTISLKNWDTFKFIMEKSYKYQTGWHCFILFRSFIDHSWIDLGLVKYLEEQSFRSVIKAIPNKNRRDLLSNMTQYARSRVTTVEFDKITEIFNILATQIETMVSPQFQEANEAKFQIKALVNSTFEAIISDSVQTLEKIFKDNELLFQQIDICQILLGSSYTGFSKDKLNTLTKLSYKSGKQVEVIKFDKANPVTVAVMSNSL